MGWFGFLYVPLLLVNAVAILNEERFLAKIGWSNRAVPASNSGFGADPNFNSNYGGGGEVQPGIKSKAINLISSVRTLMRPPLVVINIIVIVYEILMGS